MGDKILMVETSVLIETILFHLGIWRTDKGLFLIDDNISITFPAHSQLPPDLPTVVSQ